MSASQRASDATVQTTLTQRDVESRSYRQILDAVQVKQSQQLLVWAASDGDETIGKDAMLNIMGGDPEAAHVDTLHACWGSLVNHGTQSPELVRNGQKKGGLDCWRRHSVQPCHQQVAIYLMISVSEFLRPSEGLRLPRTNVLPPRCGRQRILEPPATPGGGITEVKNRNSRRVDHAGRFLLRELDEGSHRRAPRRALFRIQLHRLSGTVPHHSETPGTGRLGEMSNETLRGVNRPEQQIPKPPGGTETRKMAATSVHGHVARNTQDMKPLPVGSPPRFIAFLKVHFVDVIWNRARIDLCSPSVKGRYAVELFFRWKWYMSTHGFCSPFLGVGQVLGKQGRHPSLLATCVSRSDI